MKRFKVLSLAALVAFAACDEGSEPVQVVTPTGTISGVVTIEGTARSGVSVTLSSGAAATTDASGAYSFAAVAAGTYTVSISGFPTDATFSTTTKGATIATSGQVVTVNFDGTYVRTSAILGAVAAGGKGLAGVRVALTGANTAGASVNTDSNGQYAFTGLRAGSYTLTISGFDATQYAFASTTSTVTLTVGQSQVASFTGTLLATAKITGTVMIEGAAAAGVTATLSSGAVTTTDAAGAYTFSNLTAGTYTVTISGYAADAQFTATAQSVTITSAGSTMTANFTGTYIKTSVITGSVTVAGTGVAATVTLNTGASMNTNANGQYTFTALRAGTYTVTISGWNAAAYTFATTSGSVTVAQAESAVLAFTGAHIATASISGSLYLDEADANGAFDSTEDRLAVAGIVIQAEGGAVNNNITTTTDASGNYAFSNLIAGTYRLTILGVTGAPLNAALPGNVAFRAGTLTQELAVVTVGGSATVNWPFNITRQAIKTYTFLGTDEVDPGLAPIAGTSLWLYDTYANAQAAGTTGRIGTGTTSAGGEVIFRFLRSVDVGPAGDNDHIVFARLNTLPDANHVRNGERVIEIAYNAKDSITMAPDTFDATHNLVVVKVNATEIDYDTLAGWNARMQFDPDTTVVTNIAGVTDADGDLYFTVTRAIVQANSVGNNTFPDTFFVRLGNPATQPATHPWTQTPAAGEGTAAGRFLRFIWEGVTPASDTVVIGAERVKYETADVTVRAHREQDDSTGVTPTYTTLDGFDNVAQINVGLYKSNGTTVRSAPVAATAGTGLVTFTNIGVDSTFKAVATIPGTARLEFVSDTFVTVTLDGSDETYIDRTLNGGTAAFNSSFAYKGNKNQLTGIIQGRDGTPTRGVSVNIVAGPGNIGGTLDTTIVTGAGGTYTTFTNLLEGPYTITVSDNDSTEFFQKLTTTNIITNPGGRSPTDVAMNSGSASNTSAWVGARDLQGTTLATVVGTANFLSRMLNTSVEGVVINDRDGDFNTIDPDEALSGVSIELWQDVDSSSVLAAVPTPNAADVQVGTATTDADGAYSFTDLAEGYYIVRAVSPDNATVLRALSATGAVTSTVHVTTRAVIGAGATLNQNLTRTVGNMSPPDQNDQLPRWRYVAGTAANDGGTGPNFTNGAQTTAPAHFVHLFNTGSAVGKVLTNVGALPVVGARVTITRCQTSATAPSPPVQGQCTAKHGVPSPHIINYDTDATGAFTFSGLLEGVYQVDVAPATAGYTTINFPAAAPFSFLVTIQGNNDVETTPNFLIS